MNKRLLLLPLIYAFLEISVFSGCANIVPPQGGPRDSIPPQLLKVTPGDSTRNFTGNRIVFSFDEFIDVQNIQDQLLVSPSPVINPSVDYRLNTVTVRIKDTLDANTTYTMNFGNAIRDYTEGNPIRGFTYTFSTGPYIDSLELKGNVILAETGKLDTTLLVMLHTSPDDSAVVREKPRYVAKLDSKGGFHFKNLPPKTFYLYALKDEGGTRRYFNDRQLFAFADTPIVMSGNMSPQTLYAYSVRPPVQAIVPPALNISKGRKNTETTADTRLKFQTNLTNDLQDLLGDLIIRFEQPLRLFDSSLVKLYTDSIFTPVSSYKLVKDSSHKKITLTTAWKENTLYQLVLDKDFAADSSGKKLLRTDTLSFKTNKLIDYGSLKLRFRSLDLSKKPVLQFVLNNNITKAVVLTTESYEQALFFPGDYELRILYDTNGNGIWDPGRFFRLHQQPEIVVPVERRITVKPNSENDIEIQL